MKKKLFYFFFKKILFLLILFIVSSTSILAQDCITAKPFMWGPKEIGKSQVDNFNAVKLRKISASLSTVQKNQFYLGNFLGMLAYFFKTYKEFNYLHIYIGVCTGTTSVPPGYNNKLILIFAPASDEGQNSDIAYYILPKYFDPKDQLSFQIGPLVKKNWTDKFVSIMPLETISPNDSDNQYPSPTDAQRVTSDTRYVTYCVGDLSALIYTKNCFSTSHDLSNNLFGYLGAYSNGGVPSGPLAGRYANRITIQLELIDNRGNEFHLDDIPGFLGLRDGVSECPRFIDNGLLCPTNCPN